MASYRFAVDVMPRDGILDPQGRAVENALPQLGASSVHGVRVGRRVELTVEASDRSAALELLERLASDFLSNTLVERWEIEELEAVPA